MLQGVIAANSAQIVERAERRAKARAAPGSDPVGFGGAKFLSQVSELLRLMPGDCSESVQERDPLAEIANGAAREGHRHLVEGVGVAEVVNRYADIREAVLELAWATIADDAPSFQLFNKCVDRAISSAVSAYSEQLKRDVGYEGTVRLGVLAHEMRNLLNTVTLSFDVIKQGKVSLSGSTGAMLSRSLSGLCALVERSVAEVRLEASTPLLTRFSMLEFMQEIQVSAAAHAHGYGLQLTVHPVDGELCVAADWQLLESAVSNLLQNAFKFSKANGHVSLVTRATANRVLIDVCDECGGLPAGAAATLFRPFSRAGSDRSGLGLGLYVAQGSARANLGEITVRDEPGTGCVFTIDLPRAPSAAFAP